MRQLAGETAEDRERREAHENRERLPESVKGKQSRVAKPKFYSHAELAHALSGLKGGPFHAAMYSFGLDEQSYEAIYRELRCAMAETDKREKWPLGVNGEGRRRVHYADELCEVVLLADWCKPFFVAAPALYALYLGLPEETWTGQLIRPYLDTLSRYERWLSIARAHVERSIYDELAMQGLRSQCAFDPTNPGGLRPTWVA